MELGSEPHPRLVDTGASITDGGGMSADAGLRAADDAIGIAAVPQTVEPALPERVVSTAVAPIDGAVVSGPDWVRDPVTGDWFYSYEVFMESRTSGTVRSAMNGVVRSVMNDGGMWTVRESITGTAASYLMAGCQSRTSGLD